MAATGRQRNETEATDRYLPPAGLVSQMLAPEFVVAPSPLRHRLMASHGYAAGLRLAVRRLPAGWRRSLSA